MGQPRIVSDLRGDQRGACLGPVLGACVLAGSLVQGSTIHGALRLDQERGTNSASGIVEIDERFRRFGASGKERLGPAALGKYATLPSHIVPLTSFLFGTAHASFHKLKFDQVRP